MTYTETAHPYYVDAKTLNLFSHAETERIAFLERLRSTKGVMPLKEIRFHANWSDDYEIDRFLRVVFSLWLGAKGQFFNLLNESKNPQSLLDAYLNSKDGKKRAASISKFTSETQARQFVTDSVQKKLDAARLVPQLDLSDEWISLVHSLFPEVYRKDLRDTAKISNRLPDWAR